MSNICFVLSITFLLFWHWHPSSIFSVRSSQTSSLSFSGLQSSGEIYSYYVYNFMFAVIIFMCILWNLYRHYLTCSLYFVFIIIARLSFALSCFGTYLYINKYQCLSFTFSLYFLISVIKCLCSKWRLSLYFSFSNAFFLSPWTFPFFHQCPRHINGFFAFVLFCVRWY